ncbi:MAG: NAD(P)H-dependent oxidoreductase subunit E, partial [Thermoguttaceae bacterium]
MTLCHCKNIEIEPPSIDTILRQCGTSKDALIPILQAVQKEYRYLPQSVLREICKKTDITPADLVGVATFYDQFRHEPVGEHLIHVCTGTACHVKGADRVLERFRQKLDIPEHSDTDPTRQFTIQKVACLGCCTLAPVVQIDGITYGHVTQNQVGDVLDDFQNRTGISRQSHVNSEKTSKIEKIRIGLGSCCQAQGSSEVRDEANRIIEQMGLDIEVEPVGCVGMCHQAPLLEAISASGVSTFYAKVKREDVKSILLQNYRPKNVFGLICYRIGKLLERLWSNEFDDPAHARLIKTNWLDVNSFLGPQHHFAMEHCGEMNPCDIETYQKNGGFTALKQIVQTSISSDEMISQLEKSGLRGRGGAGFRTFLKWKAVKAAARNLHANVPTNTAEIIVTNSVMDSPNALDSDSIADLSTNENNENIVKNSNGECSNDEHDVFIVCNGDEGDPGAFMDRMLLESFPFRVIEGIIIAAKCVGATKGFFYIRAEYPLAVERIRRAIDICYEHGLLGPRIFETDFSFDLSVKEGAGAFVCGEETALLESMEGRRGMPRMRPPFPAQKGLFGKPTLINNVETYSLLPFIFRNGAEQFAQFGTELSKGTKVFALAGKIRRGGLIEVPMGISIREVVEKIGGGVAGNKKFKAVQIGGPSGGCVPAALIDTPVDFESLTAAGAIMGSGGLVVLDEDDCMVDVARYFLQFTQEQSCGKCTFCRIGTKRMLEILN